MYSVTPLGSALGASVRGIDFRDPTTIDTPELQRLLDEFLVLHFPNQTISAQQQIEFTARFGNVEPHPLGSRKGLSQAEGVPEEVMVAKNTMVGANKVVRNDIWHTDLSCMEQPPAYSVLYALEAPNGFGDTMFTNMYTALDKLPASEQARLSALRAIHNTKHFETTSRMENFTKSRPDTQHPLVRTHPNTGRNALYMAGNFIERFEGLTKEQSQPLLQRLIQTATSPDNIYRHRWNTGDVVMWDNRVTMHYAVFDYPPGMRRTLHRTTAAGERPFYNGI